MQKHRWTFEPTFNLGHIIMLIGLLGGGLSVYVGVFQTLTNLVIRVDRLESGTATLADTREITITNRTNVNELRDLALSIQDTNGKMLEQLTAMRIDVGVLKAQGQRPAAP